MGLVTNNKFFSIFKMQEILTLFEYIGDGKAYKAYEVLKNSTNNANRYKFALTCFKLNKLQEAEKALLQRKHTLPL